MIKLTFAQLQAANLPLDILSVDVLPDGRVHYSRVNGSPDLRANKAWGGVVTDDRAKALFAPFGVGKRKVSVSWS